MFYLNTAILPTISRYDLQKFIDPSNDFVDFLTSYFIIEISTLSVFGKYVVQGEGGKPELLSSHIYNGGTQYWWILMAFNGLTDESQLIEGMTIKYPSVTSLESIYFKLNALQTRK